MFSIPLNNITGETMHFLFPGFFFYCRQSFTMGIESLHCFDWRMVTNNLTTAIQDEVIEEELVKAYLNGL